MSGRRPASPLLVRAALAAVPGQWRDAVRLDFDHTPGAGPLAAGWQAMQIVAVGATLHAVFTREHVMDQVRFAARRLLRHRSATLVSLVTLACAMGAAAATWTLLSAAVLHPVPVSDGDRLVVVGMTSKTARGAALRRDDWTYSMLPFFQASSLFESVAGGGPEPLGVARTASAPAETAQGYFISANFFDLLGIRIVRGRMFTDDDSRLGRPLVALLSDAYWRRAFNRDPAAIGGQLFVGDKAVAIIGIAPAAFRGVDLTQPPDLYMPIVQVMAVTPKSFDYLDDNSSPAKIAWVRTFGRLKPAASGDQTLAQLNALPAPAGARGKPTYAFTDVNRAALPEATWPAMGQFARLLGGAVGMLLLIGCLTVGMLLLIRTEARRDEFAMCLALGATRARLAQGVAIEAAMLAVLGAALALPTAWWLLGGLRAFQAPGGIAIDSLDLLIDSGTLLAVAGIALAATLVIALVAGAFGFTASIADVMRARGGTPRIARRWTRSGLVVVQVSVTMVLLMGAGLFARSLEEALRLNAGFDTAHIVTGDVSCGCAQVRAADANPAGGPTKAMSFFEDLHNRLAADPAVASVSFAVQDGGMTAEGKLTIDGVAQLVPSFVAFTGVDDQFFRTLRLPVVRGRDFTPLDRQGSPLVAIVSESMGRWIAQGGDPLGHRIANFVSRIGQPPNSFEVVGVVPDLVTNVKRLEPLVLYRPVAQLDDSARRTVYVRATGDLQPAAQEMMAAARALAPAIKPAPMLTMDARIAQQMSAQQFGALVIGALSGFAALLTVLGIYVLAQSMAVLREREMGIRAALGASGRQLGGIVLSETARLVGLGLAVGLLLSWAEAGLIESFLFRVRPFDPITTGGVIVVIAMVALAVSLKPALRASRVDLAHLLRQE